ncbi:hypothetical protein [Wolbachia endosymbiont of Dactylopius coccus]
MLTSKLFWIPVSGHWDDKEIGTGMTRRGYLDKRHCPSGSTMFVQLWNESRYDVGKPFLG